ncbi:hypothetical protein CDAR_295971 [Caerostris darwini]|uniref:Uncharacterized protein n=1 Tax=Caerostris darwini TaxID=1538125 RepID=A0AAV4SU37_9ARAC|nr:hypothetical protein CDAR_295971 [Caerostris darwini]
MECLAEFQDSKIRFVVKGATRVQCLLGWRDQTRRIWKVMPSFVEVLRVTKEMHANEENGHAVAVCLNILLNVTFASTHFTVTIQLFDYHLHQSLDIVHNRKYCGQ